MRLLWKRHGKLSRWYNVICLKHTQFFLNTWKSTTFIHNYRTAFHLTLFTETCKSRDLWKRAIWTVSRDFVCCSIISPSFYNVTLTLLLFNVTWKIQSEARDVLKVFFSWTLLGSLWVVKTSQGTIFTLPPVWAFFNRSGGSRRELCSGSTFRFVDDLKAQHDAILEWRGLSAL